MRLGTARTISIGTGVTATFDNQGKTLNVYGPIIGGGAVNQIGSGIFQLLSTGTYAGGTTINGGTVYAYVNQAWAPA